MHQHTAIVIGGSLAGLATGLAVARAGYRVDILERSGPNPRTGGALATSFDELERVIGSEHTRTAIGERRGTDWTMTPTSWRGLREGLAAAVAAESNATLHHNSRVISIDQSDHAATASLGDGRSFNADVVIGADGHRSLVRRALAPAHPDATYAGYALWIGVSKVRDLPSAARDAGLLIEPSGPQYHLGYPMPHPDEPGENALGWAWYDATRNDLFRQTGSVAGHVVQHTLRAADIPEHVYDELDREARRHWPAPWQQAIAHSIAQREVTGIPIAEYVPEQLVHWRIAIVGNAAHVPTPMTGNGFAASLADAEAIASALTDASDIPAALAFYERTRLHDARRLVQSGQQFSRNFARP